MFYLGYVNVCPFVLLHCALCPSIYGLLDPTACKQTQITQIKHEPSYIKLVKRRNEDRGYAEIVTDITTRNPECRHIVGQAKNYFLVLLALNHAILIRKYFQILYRYAMYSTVMRE